jgi:CheY-like chemotaxis protein
MFDGFRDKAIVLLIVDSNAAQRAVTAADLSVGGCVVLEAPSVIDAVAVLTNTAIDFVLADMDLVDGPALDRWLATNRPATYLAWTMRSHQDVQAPVVLH